MSTRPPKNHVMTSFEWTLLILLSVLWGGAYFFVGVAVKELPTFTIVVARVAGAAIILHIVMRVLGQSIPRDFALWRAYLCMGLMNNVIPFCAIVWGQSYLASAVASILNATTPVFTVIVAHYLTRDERLTPSRIVGVIAGFTGVGAMMGTDALHSLGGDVLAQAALLGACVSYAFAGVYGRRFARMGVPPMATATGQVTASALVLLPLMLLIDKPWTLPMPGMSTILALVGIASLSTALAYIVFFRILATAGATNLMLVTLLIPVSATFLGVMVLGEVVESRHLVGMAFIALGLATIDGRAGPAILNRLRGSASQE
jgi:drug/metabolite transporter (DMT)-like permease